MNAWLPRVVWCLGLLALVLPSAGCRMPGVASEELPETAVAFAYRTKEEARRNADQWQDRIDAQTGQYRSVVDGSSQNEIVPHAGELGGYLGALLGARREQEAHLGRLALLDPRTGTVSLIGGARRGAMPQSWSADHRRLLFSQPKDGGLQIWEYDHERVTVRPVTKGPLNHTQACYGPEGRIVATAWDTRREPVRSYITVSRSGGRGPYLAISPGPSDHSPTCAPDESAVAYVRDSARGRQHVMVRRPIRDGEPAILSPGRQPRFTADGAWIVFSASSGGGWRLWRMRPDGSGRSPIGRSIREEGRPTVSPDGGFVIYVASEEEPRRHLYIRRFDGSGDRILFSNGDGEFPVW